MNLDETAQHGKYTMSLHAAGISWSLGMTYRSCDASLAVTPQRVVNVISALIGVEPGQLMESCRKHGISHPRQVAMMLIRDECPFLSLPDIARFFGAHHSTIHVGIKSARRHTAPDGPYERLYRSARTILVAEKAT